MTDRIQPTASTAVGSIGANLDPREPAPGMADAIVAGFNKRSYDTPETEKMIQAARDHGDRPIDLTVLHRLLVSQGPLFTAEAARQVRLYLHEVTGIGIE